MSFKASIIMPVYNVEKYVDIALESVANQRGVSQNNLELVVVDDGSTDKTLEIVSNYKDKGGDLNIKILEHRRNKGVSAARNTAAEFASGNVFIYFDGDDVLHPDCVYECVRSFDSNPSIGFVYTDHASIGPDAGSEPKKEDLFKIRRKPDFDLSRVLRENYIGSTKSVRRRDNIPFDTQFLAAGDTDWWLRLAIGGVKFYHIPEILYYWRRDIDSNTSRMIQDERDAFHQLAVKRAEEAIKEGEQI